MRPGALLAKFIQSSFPSDFPRNVGLSKSAIQVRLSGLEKH